MCPVCPLIPSQLASCAKWPMPPLRLASRLSRTKDDLSNCRPTTATSHWTSGHFAARWVELAQIGSRLSLILPIVLLKGHLGSCVPQRQVACLTVPPYLTEPAGAGGPAPSGAAGAGCRRGGRGGCAGWPRSPPGPPAPCAGGGTGRPPTAVAPTAAAAAPAPGPAPPAPAPLTSAHIHHKRYMAFWMLVLRKSGFL